VADQYNYKSPKVPDSKAGAKDLAGFIDALDTNEKKENIQSNIFAYYYITKALQSCIG
jgi:hypothetical protein